MKNLNAKVIILLVITSFGLKAQEETPAATTPVTTAAPTETKLRLGLHASPNISYIQSNDPDAESASKMKFAFGLIVEYNFAGNYSFSTGVDYIFRGGELTLPVEVASGTGATIKRTGTYKAGMVQVPLYLKMRTKEFGYMRYFADFGGRLGFPVDQIAEFEDASPGLAAIDDEKNYINPIDVMFSIGLGGEYNLGGNTSVIAGLYYNRSLTDNIKTTEGTLGTQKKYGYRFDYVNLKLGILF